MELSKNDIVASIITKEEKCEKKNCKICNLELYLNPDWSKCLEAEFSKSYFANIKKALHEDENNFYPSVDSFFEALNICPLNNINVVILGQDPYHNPDQAMGLSFSVPKGIRVPRSLVNIYKELENDITEFKQPNHGDLRNWAKQGVLLLNDTLTVLKNKPLSHAKIGWKFFTGKILEKINEENENVVFMLWGSHAKSKASMIDEDKHLVLEAGHPSPYSVKSFRGCKHFSKSNDYLASKGKPKIDWNLN